MSGISFKSSVTSSGVTNNLHLIEFTLYFIIHVILQFILYVNPPDSLILVATKVKYLADS
jgi:hypothetical protein